jgi:hypothetical protein
MDQHFARWVMLHMQSNPLPICTRPRVLIKWQEDLMRGFLGAVDTTFAAAMPTPGTRPVTTASSATEAHFRKTAARPTIKLRAIASGLRRSRQL